MSLLCLCTTKSVKEQIVAELERVQRTAEQIVHVPVPQIQEQLEERVQVIPRELFPERIEEQIVDIPVPSIVEEIAEVVQFIPQERFQQRTLEQIVGVPCATGCGGTARCRSDDPVLLMSPVLNNSLCWNFFESIVHEKQVEVDRCVLVLKREKEKWRFLEDCSFVPPRDLEELRRHIQTGKDAMAVAMRDLHACREQSDLWKRRRISDLVHCTHRLWTV